MSYSPDAEPTENRPARETCHLRKHITWYVLSVAIILSILLGFVLTIPLRNTDQHNAGPSENTLHTTGQVRSIELQPKSHQTETPVPTAPPVSPDRLFSPSSPWNSPIGTNVVLNPASSAMVGQLINGYHVPTMFEYGMPIYTSTASDPLYNVQDDDRTFTANNPIHIPDTAAPSPGTDKWMMIYDTTKHMIFEMWEANKSGGKWTAQAGNVFSPTGDGVYQVDGEKTGGNGASYSGGVVRAVDVQRGYIDHALSLATAYTAATWIYPMFRSDSHGTNANDLPMGTRVQLDPSVNCQTLPNASRGEKMICQALETYGGYIRDTAGRGVALSMYFEGEDLNDPNRNPPMGSPGDTGRPNGVFGQVGLHDQQDMLDIPWGKLRVLNAWNSFTPLSVVQPSGSSVSKMLAMSVSMSCCQLAEKPKLLTDLK